MGAEMNFKIGDRVKVSTIEDVGTVSVISQETIFVIWDSKTPFEEYPYPAYQVRLAEEEPKDWSKYITGINWGPKSSKSSKNDDTGTRLSRKEIRNELKKIEYDHWGSVIGQQATAFIAWMIVEHPKRKEIRARLRQLSAEAFCVDKTLAERIDKIADGV
jgi:hypothetical protein